MRLLRFTRRHPIALLGVAAIAFVGWVWWDAIPSGPFDAPPPIPVAKGQLRKPMPTPPDEVLSEESFTRGNATDATRGLAKLKPGMTRAEVEKLVGAPAANHVSPATITEGRVTYHATYEADLGPPSTIRPIRHTRPLPPVSEPGAAERTLVTLEYDATKPGHPLVRVHYPDPLF